MRMTDNNNNARTSVFTCIHLYTHFTLYSRYECYDSGDVPLLLLPCINICTSSTERFPRISRLRGDHHVTPLSGCSFELLLILYYHHHHHIIIIIIIFHACTIAFRPTVVGGSNVIIIFSCVRVYTKQLGFRIFVRIMRICQQEFD